MKTSKLFSAFLLGAAAGALLTPEKGSDLRKKISRNANDLLDQLQDAVADGKDTFDDLKEKIIEKASSLKEDLAEARAGRERTKRREARMKNRERKNGKMEKEA